MPGQICFRLLLACCKQAAMRSGLRHVLCHLVALMRLEDAAASAQQDRRPHVLPLVILCLHFTP